MADITSRTILDQFRNELDSRDLSRRQIQRQAKVSIRHKLREGNEEKVVLDHLLKAMDAAKIDKAEFFARVAGVGRLSLAVFGPAQKDHWTQQQRKILSQVEEVEERGDAGYSEVRAELRRIELLRDNDPKAAEAAAWDFLETHRAPGAVVGALAILAVEAPRPNAIRLLSIALDLIGPSLRSSAGGKMMMSIGRCLASADLHDEALKVFEFHALPVVALYGTVDEEAWLMYSIGMCASATGDLEKCRVALEKTMASGSERLRFAAFQFLAAQELNCGSLDRAAGMYEELVALPYFEHAEKRAKVSVTLSRLTAHFLAGHLGPADESEFREAVEATREVLDLRNQVAAVLDFALFLRSVGKNEEARDLLKAELWTTLDLEDVELQKKFAGLLNTLGLSHPTVEMALSSRSATRSFQPRPAPILPQLR